MKKLLKSLAPLLFLPSAFALSTQDGFPGLQRIYSAQTQGHLVFSTGISGDGFIDPGMLQGQHIFSYDPDSLNSAPDTLSLDNFQSTTLNVNLNMGLSDYLDLGASIAFHGELAADDIGNKLAGTGLGDLKLAAKVQLPFHPHSHVLDFALFAGLNIPLNEKSRGVFAKEPNYFSEKVNLQKNFFSQGNPSETFLMLWTFDPYLLEAKIPFRWHLNYGLLNIQSNDYDNRFLLSSAVEWSIAYSLNLYVEWNTQTTTPHLKEGSIGKDFQIISGGMGIKASENFTVTLGIDKAFGERQSFALEKYSADEQKIYRYKSYAYPDIAFRFAIHWTGCLGDDKKEQNPEEFK